jgi:hypothetical protein
MQELINRVSDISSLTNHYLVRAKSFDHAYFTDFLQAGAVLNKVLTPKEFAFWCAEKMLLKQQPFNEKTFIQYAVETTVVRYFGERFPLDFRVEAKINPDNDKDVDCVFVDGGFTFNVEVKCSDFNAKEKVDSQDAFKYETVGRLSDRGQEAMAAFSAALDEGLAKRGEGTKPHLAAKNMDNSLKDFLESAHEKFGTPTGDTTLNVLVVGCGDAEDMQRWFNYLWADEGLFTRTPFADSSKYKNVDLVVLTNQYDKHSRFFEKSVSNSWSLGEGFNLIFGNPYRHSLKAPAVKHFLGVLPHFTEGLGAYQVPGPAPDYVKNARRIPWFIKDYLEKQQGRYLFQNAS